MRIVPGNLVVFRAPKRKPDVTTHQIKFLRRDPNETPTTLRAAPQIDRRNVCLVIATMVRHLLNETGPIAEDWALVFGANVLGWRISGDFDRIDSTDGT